MAPASSGCVAAAISSALVLSLMACGSEYATEQENLVEERRESALENARDELSVGSYASERGMSDCTEDCSGHDAGFDWARKNSIEDESDCGGNSISFEEGCRAYTEQLARRSEEAIEAIGAEH